MPLRRSITAVAVPALAAGTSTAAARGPHHDIEFKRLATFPAYANSSIDDAPPSTCGTASWSWTTAAARWCSDDLFASANEGDYQGGSRGWSIVSRDGRVVWDAGNSLEHIAVEHVLYPDGRSDAKDIEPENVAFARLAAFPSIVWGTLSALSAVPGRSSQLVAVTDAAYSPTRETVGRGPAPGATVGPRLGAGQVEGLTIGGDGRTYAVTDNDALDDATGETLFLRLGKLL